MSKGCEFPRCSHGALFCFADEPDIPRYCSMHKDASMVSMKTCEFPRCSEKPLYTFVDDIATPHFCARHKSSEMVLANSVVGVSAGDAVPTIFLPPSDATTTTVTATAVAVVGGPSEAALELAFKYFELKPEYDSLETIKADAAAHQSKLNALKSKVKNEVESIHKTSKSIEKLEKQIQSQESKIINCFGKSIFGMGILMKDQNLIDKKQATLKENEQLKVELEGIKAKDETSLEALQAEQARLDELVEIRDALEARVQELRATALEYEGTTALRRLQSKYKNHKAMQESLQWCRRDVVQAHKMFRKALEMQAVAARSNAMAMGANVGQAIGGGGGRGIGNSPGERLMQIRRNQATKQSIEMAREAADKLNSAQNRLNNDLRVHFPADMAGVGIIEVPDLWHGNFFRDFLVGQAAGNIGDAVNQGRATMQIRKNMETLETVIAACGTQEQQLLVVSTKLDLATNTLKDQVLAEEKTILNGIIDAAKKVQAEKGIEA